MAEKTPTPTSIKLAAKEASKRASAGGAADPGPGDPSAAPSEAPIPIDIPEAPRPSELVVKSAAANQPTDTSVGLSVPTETVGGSQQANDLQTMTVPSARSATKGLPSDASTAKTSSSHHSSSHHSSAVSKSSQHSVVAPSGSHKSQQQQQQQQQPSSAASRQLQETSGAGTDSGTAAMSAADKSSHNNFSQGPSKAASEATAGSSAPTSGSPREKPFDGGRSPSPSLSPGQGSRTPSPGGTVGGKKSTHFRYHKRVTVKTKGKTSPKDIMDKVNYKDHKAGITPSAIEEMDPQELMRKAGIKENKKGTHWRVRLRQTERITKNGKTVTQTRVAYRDSAGHKQITTSGSPNCEKCGKLLEECECKSTTNL